MRAMIYKCTGRDSQMNARQSCVCDIKSCEYVFFFLQISLFLGGGGIYFMFVKL